MPYIAVVIHSQLQTMRVFKKIKDCDLLQFNALKRCLQKYWQLGLFGIQYCWNVNSYKIDYIFAC